MRDTLRNRLTQALLDAVIQELPVAVIVADASGSIIAGNRMVEEIWGHPTLPSLGISEYAAWRGYHRDGRPYESEEWPLSRALLAGEVVRDEEIDIERSDGSRAIITCSAAPIRNDAGEIVAGVVAFNDLTSRIRHRDRITTLQHVTSALSAALSERQVFDTILQQAIAALRANAGVVATVSDDGASLQVVSSSGYAAEAVESHRVMALDGTTPLSRTAASGEPFWLENPEMARRMFPEFRTETSANRAWVTLPLGAAERTLGALGFTFSTPQHFTPEDRDFMMALARQCSFALERSLAYEAERRARREAETANRLKDDFLALVSHELRTPMTTIIGWADLLASSSPDAETLSLGLESIRRSARVQSTLIEDLLDVSRIVTGKLRVERRPGDLTSIVRNAAAAIEMIASPKGLRVSADVPREPIVADIDEERMRQVVMNLLTNAVKFTPAGGSVHLSLQADGEQATIQVRDTGEGIPADFLPHAFEPFRQASRGDNRSHMGLGLGLSIVRRLVELHGGSVTAESAGAGTGSTFTVRIPLLSLPVMAIGGSDARHSEALRIDGIKVLIVEDDGDTRAFLRNALSRAGAEALEAISADEAVMVMAEGRPHVIVCDIGLPGEDGYAFVRRVRASGDRTPVVALTAYAGPSQRARAMDDGFDEFLEKPISPADLIGALARVMGSQPT